ncbi:MAG: cytochrome c3 family protein [Coriobacteriia bacterium]
MAAAFALALLVACGRAQTTNIPTDQNKGETAAWSLKSDCKKCHADHAGTQQEGAASIGAVPHPSTACSDCHNDEANLSKAHANATKAPSDEIDGVEISKEVCLTCHGSYAALAEKTKDSTALTDKNGLSVNPHAIPVNETHETDPECSNCHSVHGQRDPKQYCIGCHHQDVFECMTCHK